MSADTHPAIAEAIANDRVRELEAELANVERSRTDAIAMAVDLRLSLAEERARARTYEAELAEAKARAERNTRARSTLAATVTEQGKASAITRAHEAERKLEQLRNALKRWVWADANEEPFASDNLCDCADEVWGKGRWL